MRVKALLMLGALLGLTATARAGKDPVYAIVGSKVIPASGAPIEDATLILRNGLIEALGKELVVPPDARVIDGKGLTLTPGLIDGFGGVGLPVPPVRTSGSGGGGPTTPAPQTTPPTNPLAPQTMTLDKIRPVEALRARNMGVTTVLIVSREGILPGHSVLLNLSGDKTDDMVLKQPAALHVHLTTLTRQYPSSLMGTVAYLRQTLNDARRYGELWTDYDRSPRAKSRPKYDASLAAWQDVLAGREVLMFTASRENDILRALALAEEFKIRVAVAGAPQAARLAGLIKQRNLPLLVSVNFDPPKRSSVSAFGGTPDEEKEKRDIEEAEKNPAELHKAGIAFALVSGYAPNFLAGVRKAIERGLPREAALQALTLDAARMLGVADRLGSLEAGKLANVVAWSGEPLASDAKIKLIFVDGQLYEPEERPEPRRDENREIPSEEDQ
jgi:imidazolonepropionase-like amidohydrolase